MLTADDCSKSVNVLSDHTVTCTTTFFGVNVETSFDIKTCRAKPSITLGIKVDALNVDWEETFDNSVEIPIPGLSLGGFGGYLRVVIEDRDSGNVYLKVLSSEITSIYNKDD